MILLLAMVISGTAQSQMISVCEGRFSCSSQREATVGVDSRVALVWRGEILGSPRRGMTLLSTQGRFMLGNPFGGRTLGVASTTLMQTLQPVSEDRGVDFRLNESLRVPAAVSRAAAAAGARELYYVRDFQLEGSEPGSGVQVIRLEQAVPGRGEQPRQGEFGAANSIDIQSVTLSFQAGTLSEVIRPDAPLQATARIRYRGAGLLNAVWEVATPASTHGQPIYVPLEVVRRYIGGSEVILTSPQLPNTSSGLYRLRLRFLPPDVIDDLPTLSYRVSDAALQRGNEVPAIRLWPTESVSPLTRNSRFRWEPVPDSHAYQLEFYAGWPGDSPGVEASDPDGIQPIELERSPTTGQLLSGQRREASPSATILNRLRPGEQYYWRIVAIGLDGQVLAASPLEPIRP
ncbi:MAG: hypothetical protein ACQEXG_04950 [Pseudomonadota bacterium]